MTVLLTWILVFVLALPLAVLWLGHGLTLYDGLRQRRPIAQPTLIWLLACCVALALLNLFGREYLSALLSALTTVVLLHLPGPRRRSR